VTAWRKLPEALQKLRVTEGLTQKQLARKAGLGLGAVENYEGGRCLPRLDTLDRLLRALRATPQELVGIMGLLEVLPSEPRERRRVRKAQPMGPVLAEAKLELNRFLRRLVAWVPERAAE
jgi:transcriptional regulator with XRE-family HTH domain